MTGNPICLIRCIVSPAFGMDDRQPLTVCPAHILGIVASSPIHLFFGILGTNLSTRSKLQCIILISFLCIFPLLSFLPIFAVKFQQPRTLNFQTLMQFYLFRCEKSLFTLTVSNGIFALVSIYEPTHIPLLSISRLALQVRRTPIVLQ